MNYVDNNPRGMGVGESGDGGAVCVDGHTVGGPAGAGDGRTRGRLAASLYHWFAGPYQDLPINYDGTYSEAEVDAIADQWNRFYHLQFCLAQAGALSGGQPGAAHAAQVGVSHGAA